MKGKIFVSILALLMLSLTMVSAVNLKITDLELNGREVKSTSDSNIAMDYKRGEQLDVYVCVEALSDVKDAQLYAYITGYDYANEESDKISDMTDTFELTQGHSDCFDLSLEVPTKIDKDYFKLRIRGDDRDGTSVDKTYQLYLKGISRKNAVEIRDFTVDPSEVAAGRAFTGQVKVKNLWDNTIKDLKLTMSIPDLNIKTSQFMDEIDSDKSKTFEELLLRIPECTKPGTYDVEFLVEFDEYRQTEESGTIKVLSSSACGSSSESASGNTLINVPNMQEVSQGASVVYPVVINNNANVAQTYMLSVSGASTWSTTKIDPSSVVVVPAASSKTAYLYVSTNANSELGDKTLTLTITSGDDVKTVPLVAKITKGATSSLSGFKQALEVGLVILVIILIIVGLVIGFNKMKEDKKESEPYY